LAAGQTDTITFAFSGAVSGFDLADVSVTGGALSNLQQVTGDPTHYTAIFTPADGVNAQTAQIQVLAGGWTDVAGNAGTASNTLSITEAAMLTIDSGTTTEIAVASDATIDFVNGSGTTGNVVLDDSKDFTGQIIGFTGDGTVANSDSIDLRDINFATATETYTENSAGTGGTLTVTDGTNTANINFTGDYLLANFKLSADGSGGTLVFDPPVTDSQTTSLVTLPSTDDEDPSATLGTPSEIIPSAQCAAALAAVLNLIETLPEYSNAVTAITTLLSELESAGKLDLADLSAILANPQQLDQLVQAVFESHDSVANGTQLTELLQDLANSHDPPVNVESGASLEIGAASAATVDFTNGSATNGTLVLDDSKDFSGHIVGFAGDGTVANSDAIDLKDIHFATASETYAESSADTGGTLTISDGTNTANLNFTGDYTLANFKFSDDGSGGTLIIDPPVAEPRDTPANGSQAPDVLANLTFDHGHAAEAISTVLSRFDSTDQPTHDQPSAPPGVLANLVANFEQGQGKAGEVINDLVSQFENAGKLELGNLLAAHANELQQLQELVQGSTDGHNPLTNTGQLQQLAQDLTSGHNPLVSAGEEIIPPPPIDPHHAFILHT
jgi:hypothetical protein